MQDKQRQRQNRRERERERENMKGDDNILQNTFRIKVKNQIKMVSNPQRFTMFLSIFSFFLSFFLSLNGFMFSTYHVCYNQKMSIISYTRFSTALTAKLYKHSRPPE